MKQLFLVILCVFGCVAFHDEEVPNRASASDVVVEVKQPMTRAEFNAWAESGR